MKNIHLLPTDNYKTDYNLQSGEVIQVVRLGQLILSSETNELRINKNPSWSSSCDTDVLVPQHIYITNDEEIKEGDWISYPNLKNWVPVKYLGGDLVGVEKKIILTTDGDLIKDGVQAINDDFLQWFVKNPSCERVEVKKEMYMPFDGKIAFELSLDETLNTRPYYKINIPKEESKQETLEEVMESYLDSPLPHSYRRAVEFGAKWQQEQILQFLYSEITERRPYSSSKMCEEVIKFIQKLK
jgi:hypothetical protein